MDKCSKTHQDRHHKIFNQGMPNVSVHFLSAFEQDEDVDMLGGVVLKLL